MTITPLSTVYLNGDTFSASDINATNTNVNLVTATQSLISAKGDILAGTADDTLGRTAVGANDTILTADSAQTNGVKWSATFAGNSATATALQTARTIGGVSFDGTANINLAGVNTTGNQNTSGSSASCTGNSATATTAGTVTTGAQPNITSATTGTFTAGTFSGSGASLTNLPEQKLVGGQTINSASTYTFGATETYWVNNYNGTVVVTLPSASTYAGRVLHLRNAQTSLIASNSADVSYITAVATANTDYFGVASRILVSGNYWCTLLSNGTIWCTVEVYV